MPIISKETWEKFTQEEKEKIKDFYKGTASDILKTEYEELFGKEQLQPQPSTNEDVATSIFIDKQFYRFNGDGGVFCDDYRVYSNDDFWNPLNCISQKQAEKLLAINKLLNVAKFLNKDWKPDFSDENNEFYTLGIDPDDNSVRVIQVNMQRVPTEIVYFRTEELAKQAVQILGQDTVTLALSTDW